MRYLVLISMTLLLGAEAFASYDNSWYQTEFWSGEWPNGFSVTKKDVTVLGRTAMDKDLVASVICKLPYKAVFNPWNDVRTAQSQASYMTASKIVVLTALKDFRLDDGVNAVDVSKGDQIEYLIYGAEGSFLVRYMGVEYWADQSLWNDGKVTELSEDSTQQDEWLRLNCENGETAWLFTPELTTTDRQGNSVYIDGLCRASIGSPGVDDYGHARDLTDAEAKAGCGN
jgi:hypothetical protein